MLRRTFLAAAAGAAFAADRPVNLVFLLADDMGYADIGPYGATDIRTPHLDRMAKEGITFTDCYANAPVCTPTRCGLMTGRYQQRFGLEWALGPADNKKKGLLPQHSVLPQTLKKNGYKTGIFGKWHLGWNPEYRPNLHGFDEHFGILLGNADMVSHTYHDNSHDLWENGKQVQLKGYLTEMLGDRAASFIEKNAAHPFFCYVPFNAVHWPFQPPGSGPRSLEMWRDGERSEYAGMLTAMDAAIGHVMDTLKRKGLEENTLVIFTNDNGGERLSDNSPLFHHKATLFEGGIRVPAIARWFGRIAAGKSTPQVCATMDFSATMLAAAGAQPPVPLDGVDILPVLTGKRAPFERELFWRMNQPARKQKAVRKGRWKYIADGDIELLFDVAEDPGERRNLFYRHQDVVRGLREAHARWEANVKA